jgi:hypothetical protein
MADRSYTHKTLKLLFGRAKRCAYPGCQVPLTDSPGALPSVVVQIAHIRGLEPGSARYDASMTDKDRNDYANLIVFCPTHHLAYVDAIPSLYSVETILRWKADQEEWLVRQLREEMPRVTFAELEVVMKAMVGQSPAPPTVLTVVPPEEKMEKNGLTSRSALVLGLIKAPEVRDLLQRFAQLDSDFPGRLRAGFVAKYEELFAQGERGDELFLSLREFAAAGSSDLLMQDAALAVLSYLFEACEVFER